MTELIWDGKYKDGKKTAPVKIALPFQTIETVNETVQHNERTIFENISNNDKWYNRLIWGDKKYVLPSMLPEFAGKINLIYIDPPFDTGANFSFTASIPDNPDTDEDESAQFVKQPSLIEQKAYRDTWGKGIDSYVQWFYETAVLLRELLAENGSIYVHLDWHLTHYAKIVLDEVFGYENLRNELIWQRKTGRGQTNKKSTEFGTQTDTILFYTKSMQNTFNDVLKPLKEEYIKNFYKYSDADGRVYRIADLSSPSPRPNLRYEYKGFKPPKNGWAVSFDKMVEMDKEGRLVFPQNTEGRIQRKRYLDENEGEIVQNLWIDIPIAGPQSNERLNYPTQKPEALLERIIKASSNEGDLVLDCFCGSGTTAAVAEKLKRRWITCDLGRFAIHTTRKRLLGIKELQPFIVQNLGKYERQQWMEKEFEDSNSRLNIEKNYRKFIIDLYHGEALEGHNWIHGIKAGRMVHIGSVEAPVTVEDIKSSIREFWQMIGTADSKAGKGLDFLGWDFAFDVNQTAKEYASANNVDIRFKKIPREVLEKKAVEQGDIRFYELAYLSVKHKVMKGRKLSLELSDFIVPTDDIPNEVQSKISHWSQWIDYWAVDWDYQDDTFHNQWQSYRTKQSPKLELFAENEYEESGSYIIVIKVIDLLGNDTTKSITIEV